MARAGLTPGLPHTPAATVTGLEQLLALTSGCLLYEMPLFTTLSCLYLGQDNYWYTVPDLEACERLRRDVIPILRVLST